MRYFLYTMIAVTLLALPTGGEAGILRWAMAAKRADRQDSVGFSSSRRHPRARAYRTGRLGYRDTQTYRREQNS